MFLYSFKFTVSGKGDATKQKKKSTKSKKKSDEEEEEKFRKHLLLASGCSVFTLNIGTP